MNENQQTTVTATEVQPATQTENTAAARPQQQSGFGMPVPMLLILGILYFMMIRPQQRKEKERRKMIEELRVGAKVIFAGGLIGTITEASEKTFKIETAPGTVMEVLRTSIQGAVPAENPAK